MYFFGPWPWNEESPSLLAGYLIAAQLFIVIGYLLAWRQVKKIQIVNSNLIKSQNIATGIIFLKRSLLLTILFLVPTSLSRTGNFLPDVMAGLNEPGTVYNFNFARLEEGNSFTMFEYLRMLVSPFLIGFYPLAVVYWSKLSVSVKFFCLLAILFNLSLYLATGTNKGIADFVITLPWLMFLGVSAGSLQRRIPLGALVAGMVLMFFALMVFFGTGQVQREGGVAEKGVFNTGFGLITADTSNLISNLLSSDFQIIYESITRYIGQGYYALSMSFGIEHSSTLGFGHSIFLARNADMIFGTNKFTTTSIPSLLEDQTGWGMFSLWHSIYPWFASDFGFIGTLFVLAIFAYLFALSWGKSLVTLSPQWVILVYLMFILFYYIPANNQIFQSGETCFAVILLFASLIFSKLFPSIVLQSNK
ncbi:hypothetical protein HC248_00275 [Polaromonas vacuolata]|uniref:Oligosaccharide repeat unit polymerase n=1 Tax=Polaromonas vacuolata TaxID=37448 RepID=A0A6H2H560_9BURK|nr:hypothetical protein HC248_00275 [Polaromonas vacuolata]